MTVWVWDQQDTEMESKRNGIIDFAPGMSDNIINGLSGQQPSGSLLSYGQCDNQKLLFDTKPNLTKGF